MESEDSVYFKNTPERYNWWFTCNYMLIN